MGQRWALQSESTKVTGIRWPPARGRNGESISLQRSELRLAAQSEALTELTTRQTDQLEPTDERVREIIATCARTLAVARVSVWQVEDGGDAIRCRGLFNLASSTHEAGMVLNRHAYPAYFSLLQHERLIAANDACHDPQTREFVDAYLGPYHIGAMLDVPLRRDHELTGVLCVEHVGGPRKWTIDERNFVLSVANLITVALTDQELRQALARLEESEARAHQREAEIQHSRDELARELASAADMQRRLLPPALPAGRPVTFAAFYQTSRYAGGDYYDVIPLSEGRSALVVADVSGHGASAAIVMAMIRAVVHAYPRTGFEAAGLLEYVNRQFQFLWETPMFATALCAVIDEAAGQVTIACAGHPPPLLCRGGKVSPVGFDRATFPLMMFDVTSVPSSTCAFQSGDRLVFYTDGITERMGPGDSMFDLDRLVAAVADAQGESAQAVVDDVVADVNAFADGHEPHDDQTLVVVAFD
jgi:sigma-B regulation protein RsbU (phosphoserine phosphatase)